MTIVHHGAVRSLRRQLRIRNGSLQKPLVNSVSVNSSSANGYPGAKERIDE
jgi:hypothetical protein